MTFEFEIKAGTKNKQKMFFKLFWGIAVGLIASLEDRQWSSVRQTVKFTIYADNGDKILQRLGSDSKFDRLGS